MKRIISVIFLFQLTFGFSQTTQFLDLDSVFCLGNSKGDVLLKKGKSEKFIKTIYKERLFYKTHTTNLSTNNQLGIRYRKIIFKYVKPHNWYAKGRVRVVFKSKKIVGIYATGVFNTNVGIYGGMPVDSLYNLYGQGIVLEKKLLELGLFITYENGKVFSVFLYDKKLIDPMSRRVRKYLIRNA